MERITGIVWTNDEFIVMAAKTPKEIKSLLKVSAKYICQKDDLLFFRKRK